MPSATEILYEFGMDENLLGVTHECVFPKEAQKKPKVISSAIHSEMMSSKEINDAICKLLNEGKEIFKLHEDILLKANPDLIITQETCEVCAAYTNHVNKSMQILENRPHIHSMDPHNVDQVLKSVIELGDILGKQAKATEIVNNLKNRIRNLKKIKKNPEKKVLAIEWIEPFFTAGHWVPEMIEIAGGINLISKSGEHSRRLDIQEIFDSNPDIIIIMPCGFDTNRTIEEYKKYLKNNPKWNALKAVKSSQVFAVDANSYFSKPSIRIIDGIEILFKIINENEDIITKENAFSRL